MACLLVAVLGVAVQFHPEGPQGIVARSVQVAVLTSAIVVGLRWLLGRWPSYGLALAYIVWADCALAAFALTMATPEARLCTTLYLAMLGIFAGFIMGARILFLHCAFSAALIAVIVGWAMLSEPSDGFRLFVYYVPAVVWVVLAPVGMVAVIARGRSAIERTARSADYDALTGLRNRRGMYAAVAANLARQSNSVTVTIAVCDVDRFKQLNDRLGHSAGDTALRTMADNLRSVAGDNDITARIGGDELVLAVISEVPNTDEGLSRRFSALTRVDVEGAVTTASVGIASGVTDDPHFSVDDVLRHADAAMYEAKRSGGGRCVIHRAPPVADGDATDSDHRAAPVIQ